MAVLKGMPWLHQNRVPQPWHCPRGGALGVPKWGALAAALPKRGAPATAGPKQGAPATALPKAECPDHGTAKGGVFQLQQYRWGGALAVTLPKGGALATAMTKGGAPAIAVIKWGVPAMAVTKCGKRKTERGHWGPLNTGLTGVHVSLTPHTAP